MKRKSYILLIGPVLLTGLVACGGKSDLKTFLEKGTELELNQGQNKGDLFSQEDSILWKELASLETSPEIRKSWDDTLSITLTDTGKNGMLYVDQDGNNVNNNTLRVAIHNREFQKAIANDGSLCDDLINVVMENYTDLEPGNTTDEANALWIGINDYFNLLPNESTVGESNVNSVLTRAQFMAMVMRAETPVTEDITLDESFTTAVGYTDLNIYAQEVADYSYLLLL